MNQRLNFKAAMLGNKTKSFLLLTKFHFNINNRSCQSYVQGQVSQDKKREYFYYIDHNGMLFLDDSKMKNFTSCFKDKKFLSFFLNLLRLNQTGHYEENFPYVSPCGRRENNYLRCDDLPIVFTHLFQRSDQYVLSWGYAGDSLIVPFEPSKIFMTKDGRLYHPGPDKLLGVGLIRSKLAIELSQNFLYEDNNEMMSPSKFNWKGTLHELDNEVEKMLVGRKRHQLSP